MNIRATEVTPEDLDSIERAATDYIEAWLTGDADRMADCLHHDLTKRAIDIDQATNGRSVDAMTQNDMVKATKKGSGKDMAPDYEVTIMDAYRNIAMAKVDSARYIDYLHIGRFEDRWRIVNVFWEPLARA